MAFRSCRPCRAPLFACLANHASCLLSPPALGGDAVTDHPNPCSLGVDSFIYNIV